MPEKNGSLFQSQRRSTLHHVLRELFRTLGGNVGIRDLAVEAVRRGLIPIEELERCQMRGVQALCRAALKAKNENGLPFAKPIHDEESEESDTWKQLELFTYEELSALILRQDHSVIEDYREVVRLRDFCVAKFGRAPDISELREIETA